MLPFPSCSYLVLFVLIRCLRRVWWYMNIWRTTAYEKTFNSLWCISRLVAYYLFHVNSQFIRQYQVWDRTKCKQCYCWKYLSSFRRWRSVKYSMVCCQCIFVLLHLFEEPKWSEINVWRTIPNVYFLKFYYWQAVCVLSDCIYTCAGLHLQEYARVEGSVFVFTV